MNLPQSPAPTSVFSMEVDEEAGHFLVKLLTTTEGEFVVVGSSCFWPVGITTVTDGETGKQRFSAFTAYAQKLLSALADIPRHAGSGRDTLEEGKYALVRLGGDGFMSLRMFGPLSQAQIAMLSKPSVLDAVSQVFAPTYMGPREDYSPPQLLAVVETPEHPMYAGLDFGMASTVHNLYFDEIIAALNGTVDRDLTDEGKTANPAELYTLGWVRTRMALLESRKRLGKALVGMFR